MKHNQILKALLDEAESDPNVLGLLLFGSVASGTQREDSDIDLITVRLSSQPASGISNTMREGIKVGDLFLTADLLKQSVETVPYLLYPLGGAKLLLDRDGVVAPLLAEIRTYFAAHPDIEAEWQAYNLQMKREKEQYGHEKTTIIDVWNELEGRYSDGTIKRKFFDAFYFTNPSIFSLLKRFL